MANGGCPLLQIKQASVGQRHKNEDMESLKGILCSEVATMLDLASIQGDPVKNLKLTMQDLNKTMRANLLNFGTQIGLNIKPVIVLNDYDPGEEGIGTTITYFAKSGEVHRYSPTPDNYALLKGLSHLVFGVFSHVAPYFKCPDAIGWIRPLKEFQVKVQTVIQALSGGGLEKDTLERASKMLQMVDDFISKAIGQQQVTLAEFQKLGCDMFPLCEQNMQEAVRLQTTALIQKLSELKQELGAAWEQTYFVVPTVWAVNGVNVRTQVLDTLCTSSHLATHMVKIENVKTADEGRIMLGQIIGDRALGAATFGTGIGVQHFYALSTSDDLLSHVASEEIEKIVESNSTLVK